MTVVLGATAQEGANIGKLDLSNVGFAVKFDKNLNWNTGGIKGTVGAINFIPFARLGITQTINEAALKNNIKEKRIVKLGAYAQVAPGYMSVGVTGGNNLEAGINRQATYVETGIIKASAEINGTMSEDQAVDALHKEFPKAKKESLKPMARYILDGLKQGYSHEDIGSALVAMWKNDALKRTRGKVDVSAQAGVGLLGVVPIAELFVGLKFYGRATMHEDKFDKEGKERRLSAFKGYERFDNADVQNMSTVEKVQYRLGDDVTVSEKGTTITVAIKDTGKKNQAAIYDKFDIYTKNIAHVKVTQSTLTFSKGSNILMGKLIGTTGEKQKIYIGYDKEQDVATAKRALNGAVNGAPESVPMPTRTVEIGAVDLAFDETEKVLVYAEYFKEAKEKAIDATNRVRKERHEYNSECQDVIAEINRFNAKNTEAQWNDVL